MRSLYILLFILSLAISAGDLHGQMVNRELYIPMNNRSDIVMNPRIDTLDNRLDYEFKIRVSPGFKISQILFEKGLAIQNDSVLLISAHSMKNGGTDTATLRVIVTSIGGSRIWPFQKEFIIHVPEKTFPTISSPKTNVVMMNDKVVLERNNAYSKDLLVDNHPFVTMYDNAGNMKKIEVKQVTVSLMEKEGKQYISKGDTLSMEAIHELKKIKNPTPVYIRVEGKNGKSTKTVWNRIVVYNE